MANEREREEHDMSDMGLKRGGRAKVAGPIGRLVRIVIGVLVLGSITGFYLNGSGQFVLRSAAVGAGLIVIYVLLHRLVATRPGSVAWWLGSVVALIPLVLVYVLGISGGPIFGAGEGQLGALTFLGVSLVLAGLRGDSGCEVMAVPNALSGRDSHLACLVFSPIDRFEQRKSDESRAS
jgi:hypothetical protein